MSEPVTLVPPAAPATIQVNSRCLIYDRDGERVVMVGGLPVYRYHRDDAEAEALFVSLALELGWAKAGQLARELAWSLRSVHRARERYAGGGAAGLLPRKRGPKGPRLSAGREATIRRRHGEGMSTREMARQLSISRATVRSALARLGLAAPTPPAPAPLPLPADPTASVSTAPAAPGPADPVATASSILSAAAESVPEPLPQALDSDPRNRVFDRGLAAQGRLDDAAPLFASARAVPRAGVLLAIPLLVGSGVLDVATKVYGSIGPSFYGLRTILVTLLLLALLRVKHPENVKEYSPSELGAILGLDRAPEVKTIRRKLAALAADEQKVDAFLQDLLRRRVQVRDEALGFLYVDGHVRVYSGQVDLPKTHVARLHMCLPAGEDVWVHDADGSPLFFVTQEAHPSLVKALPDVLERVRAEVGEGRRVTVVFDRGGFSPELFRKMDADGFDVLTYRKGKWEPPADDAFTVHAVPERSDGATYELSDGEVTLSNGFIMRQVVRRTENGHRTPILTTRRDLRAAEVAYRMFERWRQENFFKYMRQEYAIDTLLEYGVEEADGAREVPHPARKAVEKEIAAARAEQKRLEAAYGAAAVDNPEGKRPTMRGFKSAHGKTGKALRAARVNVANLTEKRRALPERVAVGTVKQRVERLPRLRKRLSDGLKMLAYQMEADMVRLVTPFYKRSADEGRTLLAATLQSTADLEVTDRELRVTLAAQSSPHRTRAVAELCRLLDDTATRFPGTTLRLRFAVAGTQV